MTPASCSLSLLIVAVWASVALGQAAPYNPYADAQDSPPPLAADGTIHWGTFYKSAKLQQSYERLWNLGACRGSNKAITVPVAENKLVIDRLPEAEFTGVVRAVVGQAAGGMVAFDASDSTGGDAEPLVAQFHPAGVTRFQIGGRAPASILTTGMVIRLRAEVDGKGHVIRPVSSFEIVTPPTGFVPDAVRPDQLETIVGTVVSVQKNVVGLRVDAGKVRRIRLQLASTSSQRATKSRSRAASGRVREPWGPGRSSFLTWSSRSVRWRTPRWPSQAHKPSAPAEPLGRMDAGTQAVRPVQ